MFLIRILPKISPRTFENAGPGVLLCQNRISVLKVQQYSEIINRDSRLFGKQRTIIGLNQYTPGLVGNSMDLHPDVCQYQSMFNGFSQL